MHKGGTSLKCQYIRSLEKGLIIWTCKVLTFKGWFSGTHLREGPSRPSRASKVEEKRLKGNLKP